jgi:DNA-binding MarR family transcriptional regulator
LCVPDRSDQIAIAELTPAEVMIVLVDEVHRLRGRLWSAMTLVRSGTDLTALDHTVLTAAVRAKTPPTVSQIAHSLGHPRQVIQRHADGLERQGLIEFIINPRHKRARCLVGTAAGQAIHKAASERGLRWAQQFVSGLDVDQLRDTVHMLKQIRDRIEHVEITLDNP